jgi:hypothetical protein
MTRLGSLLAVLALCIGCSGGKTGKAVAAAPAPVTPAVVDYSGTYNATFVSSPRYSLTLTQTGETLSGTLRGGTITAQLSGTLIGSQGTLTATSPVPLDFTLTFSETSGVRSFTGTYTAGAPVNGNGTITGTTAAFPTFDLASQAVPRFLSTDYTDLSKIEFLTYLRSSAGHDYVDDFETCRSMKHYYETQTPGSQIPIYAPLTGSIVGLTSESGGGGGHQVALRDPDHPAFTVIIFHVNLNKTYQLGELVTAGQNLGTVGGDIAVGVNTPQGYRLISYFEVLEDAVFTTYQARGVTTRGLLTLSAAQRDADPLTCSGETFTSVGTLPIRFQLQ